MKSICVFCGANLGKKDSYRSAAKALGRLMAEKNIKLIYGGARLGIMGVLADAVLNAGGQVIGVIPRSLMESEVAHAGLTELHIVETMHARKALMAELTDAFAVLPGGYGTLDEMCEILTWNQLNIIQKPIAMLNTDGYFDAFLNFIRFASSEGFIRFEDMGLFQVETDEQSLLRSLTEQYTRNKVATGVV